ncbi:MAG: DUF1932 domain-containing protein [Hyphomicrobiaceae bacterium]
MSLKLGLLGFGEAGQGVAEGLIGTGVPIDILTWDILFPDAGKGAALVKAAERIGVKRAASAAEVAGHAELVISAVTTDQSLVAARQIAPHLGKGTLYLDFNSTSPGKKRQVAEVIDGAGAHMVEAAVMDTVPPHKHRVPLLLAGAKARDVVSKLAPYNMRIEALDGGIGSASTIKMCRSVFMKGLDGLLYECLVSANRAGVGDVVLDSLQKSFPGLDWAQLAGRKLGGAAIHSGRRAGEMREVAVTLTELGIKPLMASATADRLQAIADLGLKAYADENGVPKTVADFMAALAALERQGRAEAAE